MQPVYIAMCISVLSQIKLETFYYFPGNFLCSGFSWEASVPCLHNVIKKHLLHIHTDGLQAQGKNLTLEQGLK